jgi:hypothetical protein
MENLLDFTQLAVAIREMLRSRQYGEVATVDEGCLFSQ